MAPEFYGKIKRLRDNVVPISFTGSPPPPPDREPKVYGFDGALAAYQDASNKWVYASMRRGGRVLYAFDVTAMQSTPGTATLKWKRGCPNQADDTDCSSGFDGHRPDLVRAAGPQDQWLHRHRRAPSPC